MKKIITTLLMIPAFVTVTAQTGKTSRFDDLYHFIENLDVFEYGQEEARAYYIPGHHVLLNGKWKFFYADTPQEIPGNFFEEKFPDAKWATIDVPSNWEMRGYGDPLRASSYDKAAILIPFEDIKKKRKNSMENKQSLNKQKLKSDEALLSTNNHQPIALPLGRCTRSAF